MQAVEGQRRFDKLLHKYNNKELIHEMLAILIRDLPKSLEELETSLVQSNLPKARKAAHSLANISGTVLETEILELSRKIEYACALQNLKEVESYLPPLKNQIQTLCLDADKYLNNP
ncbi:MAG: Hpt domain-containing protein [Spirochaetales bacterium]